LQRPLITLLLFALASIASASDLLGQARAMYARGEFEQAAALARTLPGADARALAARATPAMAVYLAPPTGGRPTPNVPLQSDGVPHARARRA
jgi:hypothetical protein